MKRLSSLSDERSTWPGTIVTASSREGAHSTRLLRRFVFVLLPSTVFSFPNPFIKTYNMADQWEAVFRTLAEGTHAITEIILNANEGDNLDAGYKVRWTQYRTLQVLIFEIGNRVEARRSRQSRRRSSFRHPRFLRRRFPARA